MTSSGRSAAGTEATASMARSGPLSGSSRPATTTEGREAVPARASSCPSTVPASAPGWKSTASTPGRTTATREGSPPRRVVTVSASAWLMATTASLSRARCDLAGEAPGRLGPLAVGERRAVGRRDRVEALHVGHPAVAGDRERGHAAEPVVRVDDVERALLGEAVAELVDELLVTALRHRLDGPGGEEAQRDAGRELGRPGLVRRRTAREDLDVVAGGGERLGLVAHDDVHAADVARSGVGAGGGVQRHERDAEGGGHRPSVLGPGRSAAPRGYGEAWRPRRRC